MLYDAIFRGILGSVHNALITDTEIRAAKSNTEGIAVIKTENCQPALRWLISHNMISEIDY